MANQDSHWQKIIKDNLRDLVKCTGLGNMLVVTLLQKNMIDDDEKDYLTNDKFPKSERVTKLYTEYASQWDDQDFPNFKLALEAGKNGRALSFFMNATWNAAAAPVLPPNKNNLNVYKDGKRFLLIINVCSGRDGAEKDEAALDETFRGCRFEPPDKCENWTRAGIRECLTAFQKKVREAAKEGPVGAVVIAVGSHGDSYDYFQTSDEHSMDIYSDVIDLFNGANSPELQEIPKVFLINVCRGDKVDAPKIQTDSSSSNGRSVNTLHGQSRSFETWLWSNSPSRTESDSVRVPTLPTWANLLIVFASYDGHVAYRDTVDGTWFFQAFCDTVKTQTRDGPKCIENILAKVSDEVSAKTTEKGEKQMPTRKNVGFSKTLLLHFN